MRKTALILLFLFCAKSVHADEIDKVASSRFYPEAVVEFPIFTGIGGGFSFNDHLQIDVTYGLIPQVFYSFIAQMASQVSGNNSYQDVFEAAFQNNSIFRGALSYNFVNKESGWHLTASVAQLDSSGSAGIDRVLAAANGGGDYSALKGLLIASGHSGNVDMNSSLQIVEVSTSYSWLHYNNVNIESSLGVAKVINSSVHLKTGMPTYENSAYGSAQLRSSESNIESVIDEYGISPTVGLQLKYFF